MSIFNSVTRGFGFTIGRRAADSMLNGSNKQKVYRTSATLTLWQGIKTILWFFPNLLVALVVNMVYNMFTGDFSKKEWTPNFQSVVVMAIIFSIIIGYNYYQDNKKNLI